MTRTCLKLIQVLATSYCSLVFHVLIMLIWSYVGVIIGWDQTTHTVSEASDSLQVCVSVLSGMISSSITVSIVIGPQTAGN